MADDVDIANELAAMHIDMALKRISSNSNTDDKLKPDGMCHNCAKDVGPLNLFCNSTCATDYEKYNR